MLIKRTASMISPSTGVKGLGRAAALTVTLGMIGVAAPASATGFTSNLVERVVTVKLKMSELEAPNGIEKTYAKLKMKAERFCEADDATLHVTGETVTECTTELLTQFVESTGIESLEAYHLAQ